MSTFDDLDAFEPARLEPLPAVSPAWEPSHLEPWAAVPAFEPATLTPWEPRTLDQGNAPGEGLSVSDDRIRLLRLVLDAWEPTGTPADERARQAVADALAHLEGREPAQVAPFLVLLPAE